MNAINELLDKKPPKNSTSLKAAEYRKRCYEFAVDYAKKNADKNYVFAPQNMGAAINTSESEYFPSLTIDGKEFVFTRRLNGSNEDFFSSRKETEQWDKVKSDGRKCKYTCRMKALKIFRRMDNGWFLPGATVPDGFGSCDIYISYLDKNGWS